MKPLRRMLSLWGFSLTLLFVAGVLLFLFDPQTYGFYPRCWFYQTTGWLCPGCGSLRALHQLSHGHLYTAFRFNALLIILLPVAAYATLRTFVFQMSGRKWPALFLRPQWCWVLVAMIIIFGIARNVPPFRAFFAGN